MGGWLAGVAAIAVGAVATGAPAQAINLTVPAPPLQSERDALALDAGEYAKRHLIPPDEAMQRLRAQEESVAATDRIARLHRDRLAGIAIEHSPDYRISVLLTGTEPVADQEIATSGLRVPITFRTGARATRDQVVAALTDRQAEIRSALPQALGMGLDQRTGELVVLVQNGALVADAALDDELEALSGVPVRIEPLDGRDINLSVQGGSRLFGTDPADGRRYACTTGFVVTDGARTGILTAAHCPDAATYLGPDGAAVPLGFVGQWGVGHQDVQVHVADGRQGPFFYADRDKAAVRTLTGARSRTSTRAGDSVCHRGEATGYSCSEVELTDFSPPGDLCGGPCTPSWVTVAGPACRNGDSGGPVFNGTTAFGIAKGGSYLNGQCKFYYYMSTDFLPDGWSLLMGGNVPVAPPPRLASE
jgi:hypothetical protein